MMVYLIVYWENSGIAVFDNPILATDIAKQLNAEAGYYLDNNNGDYPYSIKVFALNEPETLPIFIEEEDVLMTREDEC